MISIIAEIGTLNSKIGFGSESTPRMTTESLLVEAETHRHFQEEQDLLFHQTSLRHFACNLDFSRKDVHVENIFEKKWRDETTKLDLARCKIKPEQYCKFLGDLINEVREGNHNECALLLIEPSYLPTYDLSNTRKTICQYLFDELNLNSVYFLKSSVSTNFSQGTTSGIVVDSGAHFTTVARVNDGYQDVLSTYPFGGNTLDAEIETYLSRRGVLTSFSYKHHDAPQLVTDLLRSRELLNLKTQLFLENPDIESQRQVQVTLPDKQTIKFDKQALIEPFTTYQEYKKDHNIVCPSNYKGISSDITQLMEDSQEKFKESLGKYITLTGGNCLFQDMVNRIQNQVRKSAKIKKLGEVKLVNTKNKLLSSWIGGSLVSGLSVFGSYWVTNKEWKENGVSIVMKKCP